MEVAIHSSTPAVNARLNPLIRIGDEASKMVSPVFRCGITAPEKKDSKMAMPKTEPIRLPVINRLEATPCLLEGACSRICLILGELNPPTPSPIKPSDAAMKAIDVEMPKDATSHQDHAYYYDEGHGEAYLSRNHAIREPPSYGSGNHHGKSQCR